MPNKSHKGAPDIVNLRLNHAVLFWVGVGVAGVLVLLCVSYLYIAYLLPLPDLFLQPGNLPASKIYDRNGVLLYEVLRPESGKKTLIPLEKIPQRFVQATLAAEDINFYSHPGVDAGAIARAVLYNAWEQRVVSGGSTITQQLVRNMIGAAGAETGSAGTGAGATTGVSADGSATTSRGLGDKLLEAIYAVRISNVYSKDKTLELYLNTIYYGNLAYGAESAALDYFGKNIYDLDLAQCSFLAGLPQSPSRFNPFAYFDRAKKRQKYVLEQMMENKFISAEESAAALAEPLTLRANKFRMKAPHFVQQVIGQIEELYGAQRLINGGLTITTTLDYDMQLKAEAVIKQQVDLLARNNVSNGALVAIDTLTGQVLAWVGSADYFNETIAGSVDMVTALRQPGSSIKPLNYLLAFEKGYTPATVINDIATQFDTDTGPYAPKNYDLEYHGPVRVRTALASSYNIPAVKTLEYNGLENFIAFLRKLGVETLDKAPNFYGLALTLGGGEVTLIDMANAFNVIANYGVKKPYSLLLAVREGGAAEGKSGGVAGGAGAAASAGGGAGGSVEGGSVLYKWRQPEGEFVLGQYGAQHAYQIIDILSDPLARMAGFGEGSVLELSRPAAVKTGTTRNFRDNWTIGFTPQLLTAVWVGNADAKPMENISGVDGAAPVWADFMEAALQNRPALEFEKPSGLEEVEICALSGKLPTEMCEERLYELFVKGTAPREVDDYYKLFNVNLTDGHIVPPACIDGYPAAQVGRKVLVDYPPLLQKWAAREGLALPLIDHCNAESGYASDYASGYTDGQAVGGSGLGEVGSGGSVGGRAGVDEAFFIDNPVNNDEYLLQGSLPLKDQRIPLRVTAPPQTVHVVYYIDGVAAADVAEMPFTYLWSPVKGTHTLKAKASLPGGREMEQSITFVVR